MTENHEGLTDDKITKISRDIGSFCIGGSLGIIGSMGGNVVLHKLIEDSYGPPSYSTMAAGILVGGAARLCVDKHKYKNK
jgi:hypothetical protein